MRELVLITVLTGGILAGPLSTSASAVTVDELFNLKANGLSDDILVALIESDGSIFQLQPEDVVALHRRGLSERVILAMIATGRRVPVLRTATSEVTPIVPLASTPIVSSPQAMAPVQVTNSSPVNVEVEVPVAVPVTVFVPVERHRGDRDDKRETPSTTYWGFGGQLRPGSWTPPRETDSHRREPDRRPDPSPAPRRR